MKIISNINILGLRKTIRVVKSVYKHGFTLLALLEAARKIDNQAYIKDEHNHISYNELYLKSLQLSYHLHKNYKIRPKSKVAIISTNSVSMVKSLFAISGLGADIILLNPNQKSDYYNTFFEINKIDLVIGTAATANNIVLPKIQFYDCDENVNPDEESELYNVVKRKKGNISVLSSGSTGKPKIEQRRISAVKFLNPLVDIIEKLNLSKNKSVFISVPLYHGYGLAALFLSVFMNQNINLNKKFDASRTARILSKDRIDCWIAVPLMIQKVYDVAKKPPAVKNIICGGDVLPFNVIAAIRTLTSSKVYNLYGTSETGVCTIATDEDLKKHPGTIGKPIKGIKIKILNENGYLCEEDTVGELFIKCSWSSDSKRNTYVPTGDLVSLNSEGYLFYKARKDDLMIIGGENIYPIELENIICKYPAVKWVKAKSIINEKQITKIHLDLVMESIARFEENEFMEWLENKVPRYMLPTSVTVLDEEPSSKLL